MIALPLVPPVAAPAAPHAGPAAPHAGPAYYQDLDPTQIAPARFQARAADAAADWQGVRAAVAALDRRDLSVVLVEALPAGAAGLPYRLLAGERRWREAGDAYQTDPTVRLPALVFHDLSDRERVLIGGHENRRRPLRPVEWARHIQTALTVFAADAGSRLGRELTPAERRALQQEVLTLQDIRPREWDHLRPLLRLPGDLQDRLLTSRLSQATQVALARVPAERQVVFFEALLNGPAYPATVVRIAGRALGEPTLQTAEAWYQVTSVDNARALLRYAAAGLQTSGGDSRQAVQFAVEDYLTYQQALWYRRHRPHADPPAAPVESLPAAGEEGATETRPRPPLHLVSRPAEPGADPTDEAGGDRSATADREPGTGTAGDHAVAATPEAIIPLCRQLMALLPAVAPQDGVRLTPVLTALAGTLAQELAGWT